MEKSEKRKSKIELDTIELGITPQYCKLPPDIEGHGNTLGLTYRLYDNNAYFKISSKAFATPKDLNAIKLENYNELPFVIKNLTGIEVDANELLNNTIPYSVHTKLDLELKNVEEVPLVISTIRECLKRSTNKFDVYKYDNIIYKNGLKVIPKENEETSGLAIVPKTLDNYRFIIYSKGAELKKEENKELCQKLDMGYLQKLNKTIRFEYQMRRFEDMREAFNVDDPTLTNILNSNENPVYTFFMKLLNETEKENNFCQ